MWYSARTRIVVVVAATVLFAFISVAAPWTWVRAAAQVCAAALALVAGMAWQSNDDRRLREQRARAALALLVSHGFGIGQLRLSLAHFEQLVDDELSQSPAHGTLRLFSQALDAHAASLATQTQAISHLWEPDIPDFAMRLETLSAQAKDELYEDR